MRQTWLWKSLFVIGLCLPMLARSVLAHEGHDHDKPPPLNLPVAPRVVAVTPQLELVGVLSGKQRLTVFLHEFATNDPVAGARMTVSAETETLEAKPEGDGVFTVSAPWISEGNTVDLIFALQFSDGSEDLLTGRLEVPESLDRVVAKSGDQSGWLEPLLVADARFVWIVAGSFMGGVLLTLLILGGRNSSGRSATDGDALRTARSIEKASDVTPLRRSAGVVLACGLLSMLAADNVQSAEVRPNAFPPVPSTMATDQPQRMPDASLFVPKATQHLLSIRTKIAERTKASRSTELSGRITPGPQNLGRVQSERPGRFQADRERVPFVGMSVNAGQVLGFVETYIEESDRAAIVSQIAETEARIIKNRTILSRYESSPGAVPQVKMDEVKGELQALIKRRDELLPSTTSRVPLVAPIDGVISAANVAIGQVVETRDILFEIINPSEFWIEAVAAHPEVVQDLAKAVAIVHDHHKLDLEYLGRGLSLRHHSTILNFKITTAGEELAAGMTVRVLLQSGENLEGFVLPASAVVRGANGLPIVWIKTQPERFEPQTVKVEPFDGDSVVVTAGIKEDQRIVTDGVTLLNQVR